MPRFLAALLILVVALTSIGLGAARGMVRHGEEIVLCTGQGVVVTRRPGPDGPVSAHVCPDMALMLLAGLDDPAGAVPRSLGQPDAALPPRQPAPSVDRPDTARARSPPLLPRLG